MARDVLKAESNSLAHVDFVHGDFQDLDSIQSACSGVERAFLLTNSTEHAEQQQIDFVRAEKSAASDTS